MPVLKLKLGHYIDWAGAEIENHSTQSGHAVSYWVVQTSWSSGTIVYFHASISDCIQQCAKWGIIIIISLKLSCDCIMPGWFIHSPFILLCHSQFKRVSLIINQKCWIWFMIKLTLSFYRCNSAGCHICFCRIWSWIGAFPCICRYITYSQCMPWHRVQGLLHLQDPALIIEWDFIAQSLMLVLGVLPVIVK